MFIWEWVLGWFGTGEVLILTSPGKRKRSSHRAITAKAGGPLLCKTKHKGE